MRLVEGTATVADTDEFLAGLAAVADAHGATVQAFDARYVVDRAHLERAVELADRASDRGTNVADDRAVEILLYAAGRRQIDRALEMGIAEGTGPAVVLVDGGDEAAAAAAIRERLEPASVLGAYDPDLVADFFEVGDAELAAAGGDLAGIVRERVALLSVEK